MAVHHPSVTVYNEEGKRAGKVPIVKLGEIRDDIVRFTHTILNKNARQPYAVSRLAGHQTSAESWGPGRAVARIPRVAGGGTHRSGQGAFGNQCRGGHMFAPTKVFRRWHIKLNKKIRRRAVESAVYASMVPTLVMARGHRIQKVPEMPLVLTDKIQQFNKTKEAIAALQKLGAWTDCERVKGTTKIRPGKGKWRNRRYVHRRGPLVVFDKDDGGSRAFRNLPGVDLANVSRLNLLQLAPGGHLGRFVIWSESAFRALQSYFPSGGNVAAKKNFRPYRPLVTNSNVTRVINSTEIQAAIRPKRKNVERRVVRRNPLRNRAAMIKLNPYAKMIKNQVKSQAKAQKAVVKAPVKATKAPAKAAAKAKAPAKPSPKKK